MSEVQLYHRLYTHMPDATGAVGGRTYRLDEIDAETVLSAAQLTRLDALLGSISPPAKGRAWAICRFARERFDYACLVVSRSARDAAGRTGVLTHARLAEVDARTAMLDLPALAELAQNASEADALDAFANRLREIEPGLSVAPWSAVNLEQYDRNAISDIIAALLAGVPRPAQIRAPLPENGGDRLRLLANVWPMLPLVFQRAVSCSLDAPEGVRADVAFSGAQGKVPPGTNEIARRYVHWLLDRPDEAPRLIESISGPGLTEFEQQLNAAQDVVSGESPMPKSKPKNRSGEPRAAEPRATEPPRGSVDPRLTEFLNEQIEASEASIYEWLQKALESHDITTQTPPSPFSRGGAARGALPSAAMAAGVIALIALLGAGWVWKGAADTRRRIAALEQKVVELSQVTGVSPPVTEPTGTAIEPAQDLLRTPESIAGQGWPERFQWVVENRQREIAPLIVRIAQATPADHFSDAKRSEMQRLLDVLGKESVLPPGGRRLLRGYIFELVAAERSTGGGKLVINGDPADVAGSVIARLKDELRVATPSNDPTDADLQSEVVLRWIAQQR